MPKVSGIFRTLSLFFAAVEGTVEALRPPSLLFAFHFSLPYSLTHSFITPSLHYLYLLQLLLVS